MVSGQDRRDQVHPRRRLTNPTILHLTISIESSSSTCKSEIIMPLRSHAARSLIGCLQCDLVIRHTLLFVRHSA